MDNIAGWHAASGCGSMHLDNIFKNQTKKKEVIRQENNTNVLNLLHIYMNKPTKYKGILFVTNYTDT